MKKPIRAAAVQFQHRAGEKPFNWQRVATLTAQAAASNAELIVFPEMCLTGYWHVRKLNARQLIELSEPVQTPAGFGPLTEQMLHLADQHRVTVGAGLIERDQQNRLYNSYVVAMPEGQIAVHRKLHCFIHPQMSSGSEFTVFDSPQGARIGVLICYDNNIVENVRVNALLGAEIILAPHQTGGCRSSSRYGMRPLDLSLWENRDRDAQALHAAVNGPDGRGWLMRWLPSRAHDNGLFYIFSNGVGRDDDEIRTGNAMILDPYGEILAEATAADDQIVYATLEPERQTDSTGGRWLMARRPELYTPLTVPSGIEQDIRIVRFGSSGSKASRSDTASLD